MLARKGEGRKAWFRGERFCHTNEGWWCLTRENTQLGPFSSHHDAENELMLYLRNLQVFHGMFEQNRKDTSRQSTNQ